LRNIHCEGAALTEIEENSSKERSAEENSLTAGKRVEEKERDKEL